MLSVASSGESSAALPLKELRTEDRRSEGREGGTSHLTCLPVPIPEAKRACFPMWELPCSGESSLPSTSRITGVLWRDPPISLSSILMVNAVGDVLQHERSRVGGCISLCHCYHGSS